MSNLPERRKDFLARLMSWPVMLSGGSVLVALYAMLLAKPVTIQVGDVDIDVGDVSLSVLPISIRVLSTAPAPDGECAFCSMWFGAAGKTPAAKLDSATAIPSPWTTLRGNDSVLMVRDTTVTGWPTSMADSLKPVVYNWTGGNGGVTMSAVAANPLDTIPRGGSRWFRYYVKHVAPDAYITAGGDATTHNPSADGDAWVETRATNSSGGWTHQLHTQNGVGDCPQCSQFLLGTSRTSNIALRKDSVYMMEWQYERHPTADSLRLHARGWVVRNNAGTWTETLVYDDGDWWSDSNNWYGGHSNVTLADSLWVAQVAASSNQRTLNFGSNGWADGGEAQIPHVHAIMGPMCVSDVTWCGPYDPSRGW